MNNVSKTLYLPLYGKAYVSRKGLFLDDKKSEEIWEKEGFPLKGKAASKWLAYYMGIRAAVFDDWLKEQRAAMENACVIHLGCGLDSRVLRTGTAGLPWYDIDFPEVIAERRRHYSSIPGYEMLPSDIRDPAWLDRIPEKNAIIVMEGVSMYLSPDELRALTAELDARFDRISLLTDCYSLLAAKLSRFKNPVNEVGVTTLYGTDDPLLAESGGLRFFCEHDMTPSAYIEQLSGAEKKIFAKLYAGRFSKKLYRLFEYRKP